MKSRLPETDSIAELARFWDAHEITEFEDQLEEVPEAIFDPRRARMVLRLEPDEAHAVEEIAEARGVEQAELLREWVREKLEPTPGEALRRELTSNLQRSQTPSVVPPVFLSYSHSDEPLAIEFRRALDDEQVQYWIDHEIRAGDSWMEKIEEALAESSIFVLFISSEFLTTRWGRFEIDTALNRARKSRALILPVRVGDVVIPESMRRFHSLDAHSMTPREFAAQVKRLVENQAGDSR